MSASDLAATLRQLAERTDPAPWTSTWQGDESGCWEVDPVCMLGDTEECRPNGDFIAWCRNNAEALATALERGERSDRCHVDAVERFVALTTALMQSIAEDEPQTAQLELIGNACNACDCVDDESIALYERAKAVAAASARDRERGAAAEAVVAVLREDSLTFPDTLAALAAYDALTQAPDDEQVAEFVAAAETRTT